MSCNTFFFTFWNSNLYIIQFLMIFFTSTQLRICLRHMHFPPYIGMVYKTAAYVYAHFIRIFYTYFVYFTT